MVERKLKDLDITHNSTWPLSHEAESPEIVCNQFHLIRKACIVTILIPSSLSEDMRETSGWNI